MKISVTTRLKKMEIERKGIELMSEYKGYDPESGKRASMKYVREKQKSILLKWKKTDFENIILPAIEASGLPTATYIKQAVMEKIERERN